jgi:hypothetical protein
MIKPEVFEAVKERIERMREQCAAMDEIERDPNGLMGPDGHEFNGHVQTLFAAIDSFEDAINQDQWPLNKWLVTGTTRDAS